VGRDRRLVAHHAVAVFDAQIVVLDDGFQHHRLARDLDLVCLDGRLAFGNGRLLPAGPLREPVSALAFADWLCLVEEAPAEARPGRRAPATDPRQAELVAEFEARGGRVLRARRRPTALVALDRTQQRPCQSLAGRSVGLLCGVGRPGSVRRSLESLGASVVAERRFPDHHVYSARDCADLDADLDAPVDAWITTEKDALKILPAWLGGRQLWVLAIELELDNEAEVLDGIEEVLRGQGRLA